MNSSRSEDSSQALLGLSISDLEQWAVMNGQPAFRGRQVYEWLYSKGVKTLDEITVLPKQWRTLLKQRGFCVGRLEEIKRYKFFFNRYRN